MKKFYAVIGNPPYQGENDNNGRQPPIYHFFMDESYKVGEKVELITPARFLFNAGQTPKEWNRKMLADEHLKVLDYQPDARTVFVNQEIKGGVAITYRDESKICKPIVLFIPYDELEGIIEKVAVAKDDSLANQVTGAVPYRFSEKVRLDYPEYVSSIETSFDLRTNVLDNLNGKLFFESKPEDGKEYVAIYGRFNRSRGYLWIDRSLIEVPENFDGYKVLLPKASGNGDFGETLAGMYIASRGVGHTQTFISIGNFDTEDEASNLTKYAKTKFFRALMGVNKVTQDITSRVFQLIPLQDFTSTSDIDWSKPIPEIDQQLYRKYGLDDDEIEFIESHVKEMN